LDASSESCGLMKVQCQYQRTASLLRRRSPSRIVVATPNLLPFSVALFVYTSRLISPRFYESTLHLSIPLKSQRLTLSPWSPPRTRSVSTMAAQGHPSAGLDALLAAVASENGLHHGLGNMAPNLRSLMNHSPQVSWLTWRPRTRGLHVGNRLTI
jgi:hypothetical protein